MNENVDPELAEGALESVLKDPMRKMEQLVRVMGEYSRTVCKNITLQEGLSKKLEETSENAILEGDYISKLSKLDLEMHKSNLEATIKTIKADKDGTKSLLNSIKNRTEYELKMRAVETEKKKAEDQGFIAMHVAKFHEMQLKTGAFANKYLGASTGMTNFVQKNLGVITLVTIGVMGLLYAFKKAGIMIKETNQGVLLSGGMKGRDWNQMGGNVATLNQTMNKFGSNTFTSTEMLDLYNQAIDNGAISLARLTLAQENKVSMDKVNQSDMQNLSMESAIQMKKMGTAIFGSTDVLPEIYKTASLYNLNIRTQTQDMLGFVANTSIELGMHTNYMMDIISSLGEKIYMTGQGIVPTEFALKKLGETFKKITKGNANYTESLMQMAGKQAQSFDILKYMAIMPNHTGDVGKDFEKALNVNPILQMQTYLKTMVGKTGSASRLAFAMPEFRSKDGIEFLKGMSMAHLTGKESAAELASAVSSTGQTSNKEYDEMGASIVKGGDVMHAILLTIQNIADEFATFASSVTTAIPGLVNNPAMRKMLTVMKNAQTEGHMLNKGMNVGRAALGGH